MKKYLFFAAALFTLAACNNDDNLTVDDPNAPVEIRLSSGIQVQTRTTHSLDTRLAADEEVHVWVDDAGSGVDNPNLYKNNILTVGDDRTTLSGGNPMYFPSTGNAVNIYAIHGNFIDENVDEIEMDNFWGTSIIHTVSQKQQSSVYEEGEGYAVSDLVYAQKTNVARPARDAVGDEKNIGLQFKHLLSKIEVVLVEGAGTPTISKVEILNTQLKAQFTPSKTADWAVSATGEVTDNNPILIDNGLTSDADAKGTNETKKILNEAIIVPQKVDGGTQFIRITTTEGGQLFYSLPTEGETFQPGMKYRYTITANLTELTVTATIDPWGTGSDNIGDAEMQ